MRSTLALLLTLLVVFGVTAWGAALVVEQTGRGWFERDTRLRAQLAVSSAREGLVAAVRDDDHPRLQRLLSQLARDERVMGASLCDGRGAAIAATAQYPEGFGCRTVRARGPEADPPGIPWAFEAPHLGGRVHMTAVPLDEDEGAPSATSRSRMSSAVRRMRVSGVRRS